MRDTLCALLITLVTAVSLDATSGVDAVFSKMDSASPDFTGISADITRINYTKVLDEKLTEAGTIKLRKRGKDLQFRIDFSKPDAKIILFRGRKAEMYFPKLQTVQEYDLGKQRSLVDQFLLVGFGTAGKELSANYKTVYGGEETVAGQKTWKLQLTPLNTKIRENLKQLELWISETGGYPVQQRFIQASGDYNMVTYSSVKLNPVVSDEDLKLKLPKGVKRETPQK
ncbi:MAG: outer membrane lipoprotein carrier protein LolA [Bryobacteraceae bacterium]|nr:outer membrane lipoprotein carrier protein LolA [Bryobacteraceae bacterium]